MPGRQNRSGQSGVSYCVGSVESTVGAGAGVGAGTSAISMPQFLQKPSTSACPHAGSSSIPQMVQKDGSSQLAPEPLCPIAGISLSRSSPQREQVSRIIPISSQVASCITVCTYWCSHIFTVAAVVPVVSSEFTMSASVVAGTVSPVSFCFCPQAARHPASIHSAMNNAIFFISVPFRFANFVPMQHYSTAVDAWQEELKSRGNLGFLT